LASPAFVPQSRDYGEAGPPPSSHLRVNLRRAMDYGEAGIAIDCFDGTIIDQRLEEVVE